MVLLVGGTGAGANASPLGWSTVSARGLHTCGIRTDGTLACWGANFDGQATPPEVVAPDTDDGLPDDVDNCPDVANFDQADLDQDGVGNACDPQTTVCSVLGNDRPPSLLDQDVWTVHGTATEQVQVTVAAKANGAATGHYAALVVSGKIGQSVLLKTDRSRWGDRRHGWAPSLSSSRPHRANPKEADVMIKAGRRMLKSARQAFAYAEGRAEPSAYILSDLQGRLQYLDVHFVSLTPVPSPWERRALARLQRPRWSVALPG